MFLMQPRSREAAQSPSLLAVVATLAIPLLLSLLPHMVWAQQFRSDELRVKGTVITVLAAELRTPRRCDLIVISRTGTPPQQERWVSVFWQREGGRFGANPDLVWAMDPAATVIDVGALEPESPQQSIVYLTSTEVRTYRFLGTAVPSATTLLHLPTLTAFPEPADLPAVPLIRDWKGTGQPWLGVPQLGQLTLYPLNSAGLQGPGEVVTLQQPTLLFGGEPEYRLTRDYTLQLIYRLPQLFVRDVDGDGRVDLIAAWQDQLAIYPQNADGRFPQEPTRTFYFNLRTEQERTLRSVYISPLIEDIDGDGRADLLITKMSGRMTDRHIVTAVYLNRAGNFPTTPDARIEHDGLATTIRARDLNGDGKRDLVVPVIRIGVRNLVRNLLTNHADVSLFVHLYGQRSIYDSTPTWTRNFTYQIDMSDGVVLQGMWPNVDGDFNGDGNADLLVVGDDEIAIYLATPGLLFGRDPMTRLAVKTSPHTLVRQLTDSGRADLIIWYDGASDGKGLIKVLINTAQG